MRQQLKSKPQTHPLLLGEKALAASAATGNASPHAFGAQGWSADGGGALWRGVTKGLSDGFPA